MLSVFWRVQFEAPAQVYGGDDLSAQVDEAAHRVGCERDLSDRKAPDHLQDAVHADAKELAIEEEGAKLTCLGHGWRG